MSGVELQRQLQIQGCRVPLIFITSFDDEGIRTQALNAGAVWGWPAPDASIDLKFPN
jgi:FixJ family two-component response regulator